ncbi:hypothetical protein [uncultured Tenacibaculum sp.]|uniref:hypothetical protein n=1 Tax=uncultured Tenacibaculum sp. TaxID=174713 RepID=UPI0026090065|nr:hypothetical protein [uncultured Tenacibaculum sp.]
MEELLKVLKELNTTFDKIVQPISETIDKIEKLDENVKEASKNTISYQEHLDNLKSGFSDIRQAASKTQESFKSFTGIISKSFDPIRKAASSVAESINGVYDGVVSSVNNKFKELTNFVDSNSKKAVNFINSNFNKASAGVKTFIDNSKNQFKALSFAALFTLGTEGIIDSQFVTDIINFGKFIQNTTTQFKNYTSGIANYISEGVNGLANTITNTLQPVTEKVSKFFGSLIKALPGKSVVAGIVKTFANGIAKIGGSALGLVGKGLVSLGSAALGAAKKGANVVSKVVAAPFKLIKATVEKYGKFKEKYEAFQKKYAVPSLNFKGVKGKLKSAYDSVSKFVKKFGDKKKLDNLNKIYKKEFSRITSVFKPVANKLIDFATEFVKGFKTISKAAEPIISMIVNLAGTIGGFLRAMFGLKEGTSAAAGAISIFKKVLDFLVTPISYIALGLNTLFEVLKPAAPIIGAVAGAWLIWNIIMGLSPITWIVLGVVALISVIAIVIKYTKGWATAWQGFKDILSAVWSQLKENFSFFIDSIVYGFQKAWYNVVDFGQRAIQYVKNVGAAIKLAWNGDFSGARAKLNEKITTEAEVKLKKIEEERQQRVNDFRQKTASNALQALNGAKKMGSLSFDTKGFNADLKKMQKGFKFPDKAPASSTTNNTTTQGINNITDGGKKQTHINVHFDRLVENMVIQSENLKEGTNDMEDMLITSLLRVLNSVNHMQTNNS